MKKSLLILVLGAAILWGGYWWFLQGRKPASTADNASADVEQTAQESVATVHVAPFRQGSISQQIAIYGAIVPAAGASHIIAVPFESRVVRIRVVEGQRVSRSTALVEVEPSPDTELQLQQARNDYDTAQKALAYTEQRFDLQLATNDQLLQAKQALAQAQAKLDSMRARGMAGRRTLHADVAGLISKVLVQEGAIVPEGNSLIEMVAQNRLEARLGVEPDDIDKVAVGQEVFLSRVNRPESATVTGQIRRISRATSATTRLVDVFVHVPSSARFLLGEYVLGKITLASAQGLIVPRSAVLPQDDSYVLFTVKDGRAQKHSVHIGLQDAENVQIIGPDLHPGDLAVTLGNYELEPGMAVKVAESQ